MIRFLFFLCLLFCALSLVNAKTVTYSILDETYWDLSLTIRIENSSTNRKQYDFESVIVSSDSPSQELVSVNLPRKPDKTFIDESGNKTGIWKLSFNPKEIKVLNFNYLIKARHIRWNPPGNDALEPSRDNESLFRYEEARFHPLSIAEKTITENEKNPYYRALLLYDYILGNYHFKADRRKAGSHGTFGMTDTFSKSVIQCSDAAFLYSELLKASGISSKYIGGLFISEGRESYNEFHAWTEILFPGYSGVSVDPTLGRFDTANRLKCFFERRMCYISIWKGYREPFNLSLNGEKTAGFSFMISVKKLPGTKKVFFREKSDGLTMYYKTLCSGKKKTWESSSDKEAKKHFASGRKFEAGKLFDKSIEEYFKSFELSREYLDPVIGLLRISEIAGNRRAVQSSFMKRVGLLSSSSLYNYALGELEYQSGHYSESKAYFNEAEKKGFYSEKLFLSKMKLFEKTKEIRDFDRAFYSLLEVNDKCPESYKTALLFYMNAELWDRCIYWSVLGKKRVPDFAMFDGIMGFAYMRKGELKDAAGAMRAAIKRSPDVGWYYCIYGWILLLQGDKRGARENIEKGISLGKGVNNPGFFRSLINDSVY